MASAYFPPECEGFESDLPKKFRLKKTTPKKGGRTWDSARARSENSIAWQSPIGEVKISASGFWLGKTESAAGYYWAEVKLGDRRPIELVITFAHNLVKGIIPFYCYAGQVIDCGDQEIPELHIPIEWQRMGNVWVPKTRVRDRDNADLVLRNEFGQFIDLQVAIVSRSGKFYLSIQEISSGQIMRLPSEVTEDVGYRDVNVDGRRFIVVPILDAHAYPGADFLRYVMQRSGPALLTIAAKDRAYKDAEDGLDVPEWTTFDFPVEAGWTGAVVLWFNPLIGARVKCAGDGIEAFVPIGAIPVKGTENDVVPTLAMKAGEYALVLPGQQVLVRTKEGDQGRYTTAIKPIWPK